MEGWVGYQARMRFGSLASTLCPFISLLPITKWVLIGGGCYRCCCYLGGEVALEVVSFLG